MHKRLKQSEIKLLNNIGLVAKLDNIYGYLFFNNITRKYGMQAYFTKDLLEIKVLFNNEFSSLEQLDEALLQFYIEYSDLANEKR